MRAKAQVCIDGTREMVWQAISDIDSAADRISGIEKIEILERPPSGLVGLKWRETRVMFGKEATEVMWITDAKENEFYETRAESRGTVYESGLQIEERDGETCLTMGFEGMPQGLMAKIMSAVTGPLFKGATQKALQADLEDIKAAVEGTG